MQRFVPSTVPLGGILLAMFALEPARAQTNTGPVAATPEQNRTMLDRLGAQEARIRELESEIKTLSGGASDAAQTTTTGAGAAAPSTGQAEAQNSTQSPVQPPAQPAAQPAPQASPAPPPAEEDSHDHMMTVPHGPTLHIRGFFDIDLDVGSVAQQLEYPLSVPAHTSFRSGEFDLFMTSQVSDNLSFLTELVFATDETNDFGVDLERFELSYKPSRYFEISGGRFHTDIGYYNTTFHHGNWFSTATGRPFMYYFEDAGGVLPVHEVGVSMTGLVPGTGRFNVHWTAEIGNGSSENGSPLFGDGVEGFVSDRNRKDLNFAVYSKPDWIEGLQIGGSFLNGELIPADGTAKVIQDISSAYAVYTNSNWEFMNEAVLLHQRVTGGGRSYNAPLAYSQLAYRFGKYHPYFRFQEVNLANDNPVTGFKGRYEGPSVGMRVDFFTFAALKAQYNRVFLRDAAAQNGFEVQMAFTF